MFFAELTIALMISALVGIWSSNQIIGKFDDAAAEASGLHLNTVASAAQSYALLRYDALANGTDVPGVAVDLQPTVEELRSSAGALPENSRLPASFPVTLPNGQALQIIITRSNCPGAACLLSAMVCSAQPITVRGQFREDLATLTMLGMGGRGGRSHADAPAVIRGPALNAPNPFGAVNGIVCASATVDAGIYDQFVKRRDTRDPDLRGGLTLQGTNATGETLRLGGDLAMVNPATGTPGDLATATVCVRLLRNGQVDINCDGRLNAALGTFTAPGGAVARIGQTGTNYVVDATGRIRAEAGFWSAVGSLFGDNTLGVRAQGTVFTIQTSGGIDAMAVHDSGRVGARNSLAAPMLGLTDPVTIGSACTAGEVAATQVTSLATTVVRAVVGGGLAVCTGGQWSSVTPVGTLGGTCTPSGSVASTSSGVALYCQNNTWILLSDRVGGLIAAESWKVSDGQTVVKPVCAAGSTGSRIYLQDENTLQKTQYVNRQAIDNGSSWTVRMTDGAGAAVPGTLVVTTYCTY